MEKGDLGEITKEDLIRYILSKEQITREELIKKITQKENKELIPITIFATRLSPLEAITRYIKEKLKLRTSEIARKLNKNSSTISTSYKKSKTKRFHYSQTNIYIPISEFQNNPKLSILEIVVKYLRKQHLRITDIAKLLKKSPKTIWTIKKRGELKSE